MNLTFIQKNQKIIYIAIIVIFIVVTIFLIQFFSIGTSNNKENNIVIPKGVPVINKSKFSLGALDYSGENFSVHYLSAKNSVGNMKGDTIYVHIEGINFSDTKTVRSQIKLKMAEARRFLLNHGINPKSKHIVYTFS